MPRSNELVKGKDLPDQRLFLKTGSVITATSPLTIQGTNPVLIFDDTDHENFRLDVQTDILSIINDTGPITFIRFRGGANDDIQVDRPITFNSTVSGLTFTDITLSDASPTITFTDTGGDDFSIGVDANLMTFTNITQGDLMTFGNNPVLNITPAGVAEQGLRITVDNQTSSGIATIQIVDNNNGTTNFVARNSGEVRVAAGYPANLSDVPSKTITLGGQFSQNVTLTGNVGSGQDTLHTYTIDGNVLANDGDTLDFWVCGNLNSSAGTEAKEVGGEFGGTFFFLSGSLTEESGASWSLRGSIWRKDSDSVIINWTFTVGNPVVVSQHQHNVNQIDSLDFTSSLTLRFTGQDTGSVPTNNTVEAETSWVRKFARAQ